LESHRKELESNGIFEQTEKNKESAEVKNFNHSYYQGLLLTMGNLRGKIPLFQIKIKTNALTNEPLARLEL